MRSSIIGVVVGCPILDLEEVQNYYDSHINELLGFAGCLRISLRDYLLILLLDCFFFQVVRLTADKWKEASKHARLLITYTALPVQQNCNQSHDRFEACVITS